MDLKDKQLLYKIVCARDKRYDGRFYCGVRTTGIYCRPICPAKPKIENITFYRSATEAENAGFRPCMRCRPDLAPNSVQWDGTAAIVGRALTLISQGDADDLSLNRLADRLGISDRHLRRLFEEHIGASPIEVATSKRLHMAKQLLMQSNLSVTEIVFASGYKSIRRFNEAFREKFQVAPSAVRKSQNVDRKSGFIHVDVPVITPYNWDDIYEFLKNHRIEGVEDVSGGRYRRAIAFGKILGAIEVGYDSKKEHLSATVAISDPMYLRLAIERLRDLFDTRLNPHMLGDFSEKDSIGACYRDEIGIRIPGAWDNFETAACIVLGQLVSVEQARMKVKKLVQHFGTKISNPIFEECAYLFPSAQVVAKANLRTIGLTKVREAALRELAKQVAERKLDLSRSADIQTTRKQLLAIKGIGPWTVEMIAMRCLGDMNAFPKTDLIIKRALEQHKLEKGDWSPWNAYITLALWKKYAVTLSRKSKKPGIVKP